MANGAKNWVFCDGDLPPAGDNPDFSGHEALMITNLNREEAKIRLELIFEDRDPYDCLTMTLGGKRTKCLRLDKPICDEGYQIPKGQYTLVVHSDVPVCACFGRLDVRQPNMAYYSVAGYSFSD